MGNPVAFLVILPKETNQLGSDEESACAEFPEES
jgi:hypothetical protein